MEGNHSMSITQEEKAKIIQGQDKFPKPTVDKAEQAKHGEKKQS